MWWSLIPFVVVTAALLLLPGTLVNLTAGLRGWSALGFAPMVSAAVIASGAIVAQFLGAPWGPVPIVFATLGFVGLAALVRLLARRWRPALRVGGVRSSSGASGAGLRVPRSAPVWTLGGWAIAAVLMTRNFVGLTGSPQNFSQTFDNLFHLNAVRWIAEHRLGSALDMRMVTGEAPAGFYPTAWHDIASATLLTLGSTDAVRATAALALTATAVVWPLSCLLLVRRFITPTPVNQLATGVLAIAFPAFPYLLLGFGVLYPNLLGMSMLPAMTALAMQILGLGPDEPAAAGGRWVSAGIGLVGLALAHPNVAFTLVDVIGVILIVCWAVPTIVRAIGSRDWTALARFRALVLVGWLIGAAVALKVVRPPITAGRQHNWRTVPGAIAEFLSVSPMAATVVAASALLALLGIVVQQARRRYLLVLLHAGVGFLWLIGAAAPEGVFRDLIVGPWFADSYRLASLLPLTAVPLAVVGVDFLAGLVGSRRPADATWRRPVLALGIAALLIIATQFGSGRGQVIAWAHASYGPFGDPGGTLVSADEYALITRLPQHVPPDDVVAVNPWNGSSMAYAIVGVHTNHTHALYMPTADDILINDQLNQLSVRPEVCAAVRAEGIGWVLDFWNEPFLHGYEKNYPGLADLAQSPGFEVVDRQGAAVLYRITGCP